MIKSKPDTLAVPLPKAVAKAKPAPEMVRKPRKPTVRLPQAERRAQILSKAYEFFSEHGLTAQTRSLAEACGISQRLLYSVFPSKAALLEAVYETEVAGPIKDIWFVHLRDRTKPVEQRLNEFYCAYYESILTRRWLRLFLYASLAEATMAPAYIGGIVKQLVAMIVKEAAHELGLRVQRNIDEVQEVGWILHGAISHFAIRRHIYHESSKVEPRRVIALHVKSFLGGLDTLLPAL